MAENDEVKALRDQLGIEQYNRRLLEDRTRKLEKDLRELSDKFHRDRADVWTSIGSITDHRRKK